MHLEPGPGPADSSAHRTPTTRPSRIVLGLLVVVVGLLPAGLLVFGGREASGLPASAEGPTDLGTEIVETTSTMQATTTLARQPTSTLIATTTLATPQPRAPRYEVAPHEAEPEAKQLAVDIAQALTTYDPGDSYDAILRSMVGDDLVGTLLPVAGPLFRPDHWSRGTIVYPQMGGLRDGRASVMVVTRQVLGRWAEAETVVTRTLDIRLVVGEAGWEFEMLASAGGEVAEAREGLSALAQQVLSHPRIELPDSARWDIHAGIVSPTLLQVMLDIAELTEYGVVCLSSGHPYHVFGTNRQSHHTSGMAVDIYRVGDVDVISDRHDGSDTMQLVEWLLAHPDVRQVGSPWDLDGRDSSRSFTDRVHHDHIHVAVRG